MKHRPLFESQNLRITSIDLDKDSQVIAAWTYDLDIARRLREEPARPMPVFEVKKVYEKWQKEAEDSKQFLFAIRRRDDESVMGVLRIANIAWVHGAAFLDLIIGNSQDWKDCAHEALDLALRYAFDELGLFRVTTVVAEHNQDANELFSQANFTLEVRQRQAIYWNKRSWDKLWFGLLRPEWKMKHMAEVSA
jgi:RimJ/RimL family protein N-acetyltransferase